ncbi:DUF7782 domain-containing protein [Corynebacterium vitaeruminis]|uniref:DUF7782 domain-containing protein n=1 Tax=Corynebacterium vitaeruminis TaxID=38305 RepID=UPI0023F47C7A|nr:methyltransferase [Corynebacterium vitaeruminis]
MRTPLGHLTPQLVAAFRENDFTATRVADFLGEPVMSALYRGEPGAVLSRLKRNKKPLAILISFFLLHRPTAVAELEEVLGADLARDLFGTGLAATVGSTAGDVGRRVNQATPTADELVVPMFDVRPVTVADEDRWVFSDRDASMVFGHIPAENHVLGVGAASVSLMSTTPRTRVGEVLDLGTGSGVQALSQLRAAESITATDFYGRALDLAEATLAAALNDPVASLDPQLPAQAHVELLEGSWFEPVAGRKFDRIVSNPPFVVGTGEIHHGYRDSGLDLDGATELVVRGACEHLKQGGIAHILGSWVHDEVWNGWSHTIASWLPDRGVRAWVLERDVADPELYVGTWLKDESIDPRSPEGIARTEAWLRHFQKNKVTGIGFGYIAIQKIDDDTDSDVNVEELSHPIDSYIGDEIEEYFLRTGWLHEQSLDDILASRFLLRPGLALENVSTADEDVGMGFSPRVLRITRTEGPRFSHEIDEHLLSIISGLHPQGLPLGDVIDLYAMSAGFDEAELRKITPSRIIDLVRHGVLLPASLIDG